MENVVKNISNVDPSIYANNCENCIGGVVVPIGVAGPVVIDVTQFQIPLATTEAALVASVNRGCKVLRECGVKVSSEKIGITRSPIFEFNGSNANGEEFYQNWINDNLVVLNEMISVKSSHTSLLSVVVKIYNNRLYVKFWFDTDEAMGMNMATIATDTIARHMERELNLKLVAISSNWCSDKKISLMNLREGRGFKVTAETEIDTNTMSSVLKTNIDDFVKVYEVKIVDGSNLAESVCKNAHLANMIAAIFIATGQDAAHIAESSFGNTTVEKISEDKVRVNIELTNLVCGFVGGGTELPHQREAIQLSGCKNLQQLVELIGAACLAGEISLLASIAENSLARVHEKFRNKK